MLQIYQYRINTRQTTIQKIYCTIPEQMNQTVNRSTNQLNQQKTKRNYEQQNKSIEFQNKDKSYQQQQWFVDFIVKQQKKHRIFQDQFAIKLKNNHNEEKNFNPNPDDSVFASNYRTLQVSKTRISDYNEPQRQTIEINNGKNFQRGKSVSCKNNLIKTIEPRIDSQYRSSQRRQRRSLSIFKQRQKDPSSCLASTRRIYMQKIADESSYTINHQPQLQGQLTKRRTRIFPVQSYSYKQYENYNKKQINIQVQAVSKQNKKQTQVKLLNNIHIKENEPKADLKQNIPNNQQQKNIDKEEDSQVNANNINIKFRNSTNQNENVSKPDKKQRVISQMSLKELEESDSDLPTPQQLLKIITHMNNKNKTKVNQNRTIVVNSHRTNHHQLYNHYQNQFNPPPSYQVLNNNQYPTIVPILPATHYIEKEQE